MRPNLVRGKPLQGNNDGGIEMLAPASVIHVTLLSIINSLSLSLVSSRSFCLVISAMFKKLHIRILLNRSSVQFIKAAFKQSWNVIAFPRCKATERRCLKNKASLSSPDTALHRLPSSFTNAKPSTDYDPNVSTATATKSWLCMSCTYLRCLLTAACSAAL